MPISPQEIYSFVTETYAVGICLLAGGVGAVGALWYLHRRHLEGEPQTHAIAQSFEEAERIASAQSVPVAVEEIRRNQPGKPSRIYLRLDN